MPQKAIIVISLSTALGLATVEAGLRLLPAFRPTGRSYVGDGQNRPSKNFVADPNTGWRMRPDHAFTWIIEGMKHTYRSNAQGFRSPWDFAMSRGTTQNIALTGDSFTFGTGVDHQDTYGGVTESRLQGALVYNFAMPGFGLDQIWLSIRHQVLPMKPVLVIAAFIDEDLDRSLEAYRYTEGFKKPVFKLVGEGLSPKTARDSPHWFVRALERRSTLWRSRDILLRHLALRVPVGEWWLLNEAIFDSIRSDCRRQNVPLLFVRMPNATRRGFPTLGRYMERTAANYLDLMAPGRVAPTDIHYPRDGHLNAKGHAHVATEILAWIRTNLPGLLTPTRRPGLTRPRSRRRQH